MRDGKKREELLELGGDELLSVVTDDKLLQALSPKQLLCYKMTAVDVTVLTARTVGHVE